MNSIDLALSALILLLLVELLMLINNAIIFKKNKENDHFQLIIQRLRKNEVAHLKEIDKLVQQLAEVMKRDGVDNLGFIITAEGVKSLPKGWREKIQRLE